MPKKIILNLKSIRYSGDSIGDDIRLEITIRDKVYILNKTLKPGSFQEIGDEIARFEITGNLFGEKITIKVTEKDLIFNDTSQVTDKINVNLDTGESQERTFEIKVQEMRKTFGKSTAIFTITLVVDQIKRIPSVDDPEWTGNFRDDTEQMILARAIWGEARGSNESVRVAVGWSIKNRLGTRGKNGKIRDTYHKIILESSQYSAFWEVPGKDQNLQALRDPLGITKNLGNYDKWKETYLIAGKVINGEVPDPTQGANHYFDDSISPPYWATKKTFKKKIGTVNFYKL